MWDINYMLEPVSKKTGLSPEEIRKTPWHEIEELLGIEKVNLCGTRYTPEQVMTKKRFQEEEKECLEFLQSFYKNRKEEENV